MLVGQDQKLWEEEVFKFARHQQLRALSPYLPRGGSSGQLQLNPHVYEMVLYEYINTDHIGQEFFHSVIRFFLLILH
jgi:hypothetical protein